MRSTRIVTVSHASLQVFQNSRHAATPKLSSGSGA
jgi:hypothetical protein